jgi:peptide/nickel transport system permease protein
MMINAITQTEQKIIKKRTGLSLGSRILKRLSLFLPLTIMSIMVICAIFAPLLAPRDPTDGRVRDKLLPPSWMEGGKSDYFLGTDRLGRDVFSRLIYGARVSLSISLLVIAITATIGTGLGILAGYLGGRIEAFIMRFTDVALSFPGLLLAILLAVSIGPGFSTVVLALSILGWSGYTRMIRGEAMRLRDSDFVAQARVNGASTIRIMVKHIFPNIVNSLIVIMTLQIGMMILAESALSYLGIGITAPTASWGSMVSDGRTDLDRAWWISAFPGIAIGLVVLSGNFLGDWLRDKLDPRLRRL